MDITELDPSELGTRQYWKWTYARELQDYIRNGSQGDNWFGEDCANRIIDWFCRQPLEKTTTILDIGSGNGRTLSLLARLGFSNLTGVDYCQDAITLAENVTKPEFPDIKYKNFDITQDNTKDLGKFGIIHDKGTYDAIGLNPEDPKRCREKYIEQVDDLLEEEGRTHKTQIDLLYAESILCNIKQVEDLLDDDDKKNNITHVEEGVRLQNIWEFKELQEVVREHNIWEYKEEDREDSLTDNEELLDAEVEELFYEENRVRFITKFEKMSDEDDSENSMTEIEELSDGEDSEVEELLNEDDRESNLTNIEELLDAEVEELDEENSENNISEDAELLDDENKDCITKVEELLEEERETNVEQVGDMNEERRNIKCNIESGAIDWKITEIEGMKCVKTVDPKEFNSYINTLYPQLAMLLEEGTKVIEECKEMKKERRKVINTVESILKEERAKEVKNLKE